VFLRYMLWSSVSRCGPKGPNLTTNENAIEISLTEIDSFWTVYPDTVQYLNQKFKRKIDEKAVGV
jgi:hypothetical protein